MHVEFYLRNVTGGMRTPWKLPVVCWCQCFQEVFDVAWKLENTVPPVIVLSSTHLPRTTPTKVCNFGSIVSGSYCVSAFGSGHWRTVARGA